MKKLKLSPVLMLAVVALAAFIPVVAGLSPMSLIGSASVVVLASLFVEKASGISVAKHPQAGEVGEDLRRVEKEYQEVNTSLKKISDDLKSQAETAQKELKKNAELSGETKASVDKLLTEQGALQARLVAAEQKLVSMDDRDRNDPARCLSIGSVVAESEEYKNFDGKLNSKFAVGINAAITSLDSSAGSLIEPQLVPGIVAPPRRRLTIRDLLAPGRMSSDSIKYVRELLFTNNANVVSENPTNPKPQSEITFEADSADAVTIAHWVIASKQVLSDAAMLQSYIDGRLRYGLQLKEEAQLLKGSGVGLSMNGIWTQASDYVNPGVAVQAQTRIDQLRLALLQAELAEYYADGIVLSPIDWAAIELTKDKNDNYIVANPFGTTNPMLWSRPVVPTQSMDVGDFLVGAFRMGAQVWDREDASVVVSTEDRDNFVKNMVTILAEERLALTVYRPEAFVKGEFEAAAASS